MNRKHAIVRIHQPSIQPSTRLTFVCMREQIKTDCLFCKKRKGWSSAGRAQDAASIRDVKVKATSQISQSLFYSPGKKHVLVTTCMGSNGLCKKRQGMNMPYCPELYMDFMSVKGRFVP